MKSEIKRVLIDQNIFEIYNNNTIDLKNLLGFLDVNNIKIYLMNEENSKYDLYIPSFVKGTVSYSKKEIRKTPIDLLMRMIAETRITSPDEILIISSDQELLKIFECTALKTCLVYKNMYDVMETKTTYEVNHAEHVKKLIY